MYFGLIDGFGIMSLFMKKYEKKEGIIKGKKPPS